MKDLNLNTSPKTALTYHYHAKKEARMGGMEFTPGENDHGEIGENE